MIQGRINHLPDEILISILSRMTIKEAAQTSVISRRWKNLWTSHPRLDFDESETLIHTRRADLDLERAKYLNWVNHIVESCRRHSALVIDEFKVYFHLEESHKGDIDEWVRFAFEKKVKVFKLSLYDSIGISHRKRGCYPLCYRDLCLPSFNISLTSLVLRQVNVSDQVIADFLSNCPFLEKLCVAGSSSIIDLRVVGPSLRLKYLEIIYCFYMKSLEVDAANLLSLKMSGVNINICSVNAPNLAELLIGGMSMKYLMREILVMSKVNSQLQKLAFVVYQDQRCLKNYKYPVLSQVKELRLHVFATESEKLLWFSSLINACPSLTKLRLELRFMKDGDKRTIQKVRSSRPHDSLKVVEIAGFVGKTIDTEFCMYLIEHAIMLEKIIINPWCPLIEGKSLSNKRKAMARAEAARERAEQLRSQYLLGNKLEFCDDKLEYCYPNKY